MTTERPQRVDVSPRPGMNPGDEAPPGPPDNGENLCPKCGGTGRNDGEPGRNCGCTGRVIQRVGGA